MQVFHALHDHLAPVALAMSKSRNQSGNMIFVILLAIVLIGLVTAALRSGGLEGANIDKENVIIKATQVRQHAAEMERGVAYVLQNGGSETNISFAHPDAPSAYGTYGASPENEIFNPEGGGAAWRTPPSDINDGSGWEFYGTPAIPGAGTGRADLVAVLPNVTEAFCAKINEMNEQTTQQPEDSGTCLYSGATDRFVGLTPPTVTPSPFDATPDGMNEATFDKIPALEACVRCGTNPGDALHFYHVLMVR